MSNTERAANLIKDNIHMVVATASLKFEMRNSPVFFMYDPDDLGLYWVSEKEARHSAHIREQKNVAITILGEQQSNGRDAIFFQAKARELSEPSEIWKAIEILKKRPQPPKYTVNSIHDVTGQASWGIYKAEPYEVSLRASDFNPESEQARTVREIVDMNELITKLRNSQ